MTREFQVNWDDVAKGEAVPPGRYPARIDKVEDQTSEKGNAYWQVTFTLTEEPAIGRKVWGNFMLQPQSLWKLRQLMKAIGMPTQGVGNLVADEFIGQEVGVIVINETYEGEPRSRVQGFFPLK
jgi:hypothetical protein